MKKSENKEKVALAFSGGVDSSVAARKLLGSGKSVSAIFMRLWDKYNKREARARGIANKLGIDFIVWDLSGMFKETVMKNFLEEIKAGNTPNPCVFCNRTIKFGVFLDQAKKEGFNKMATGHYARIKNGQLYRGIDKIKDQSYFLWKLKKKDLKNIIFPMGNIKKTETRKIAEKLNLGIKKKEESKEICFVEKTLSQFVEKNLGEKEGDIVTPGGDRVGKHRGLYFYTIGQRKGLGASFGPWYVVKKDMKNNKLVVSKREKDIMTKEAKLREINWINQKEPKVSAQIRYGAKPIPAFVKGNKIIFQKRQRAITPGQSAVFYRYSQVLGGGIIS